MDKINFDELWEKDENGIVSEPFEELLKKINEIIDWINRQG